MSEPGDVATNEHPNPAYTPPSDPPPPAHEAMRLWFNEKRGRRTGLARLLGLTAATVSSWGRETNPSRPHEPFYLYAVQELVGIPTYAWLTQAELTALEAVFQTGQLPTFVMHRRPKDDPRQLSFDHALARLAADVPAFDDDDVLDPGSEPAIDVNGASETFVDVPPFNVDEI